MADHVAAVLGSCYRETQVEIPIRLNDGRVRVFRGYRVQHKGVRGRSRVA
ncbi:MAG: Glu/Leu/Phe/Val dehydrogenase dimerization domain-containing protein [Thermoleophilaceae bacterium]